MKTTENIKLTTAGKLLGELKKYKKNHWDDCVVAWLEDDELTFGVVGMGNDKDGDLRIIVEVVDDVLEGFWTVEEVISSLECKGKDARVYLAGEACTLPSTAGVASSLRPMMTMWSGAMSPSSASMKRCLGRRRLPGRQRAIGVKSSRLLPSWPEAPCWFSTRHTP